MSDQELLLEIVKQIEESLSRIERRFSSINQPEDFLRTDQGLDKLDGIAMMLIWLGENLKNFEKSGGAYFFESHTEIDWKGAKGMRDILSHHYGNIDPEIIFSVCQNRIPALVKIIKYIRSELESR